MDVPNMSLMGKTMFGRVILAKVQEQFRGHPHLATQFPRDFVEAVLNGLTVFVDFGTDRDWIGPLKEGLDFHPSSWMALRILTCGYFGVPTCDFVCTLRVTPDEVRRLSMADVLEAVLQKHRKDRELDEDAPVLLVVHVDGHRALLECLDREL